MKLEEIYIEIQDFIKSYIKTQEISKLLTGEEDENKYLLNRFESEEDLLLALIIKEKWWYDKYLNFIFSTHIEKRKKNVYVVCNIKTSPLYNLELYNYLNENLIKKLKYEGFNNTEFLDDYIEITQNFRRLKITLNNENYSEQLNKIINIINLFNQKVYKKLIHLWEKGRTI